ncbi:MAG: hypothetical protein LBT79_07825 [Elusimicrobiota bacterium]|nr:hypothetical protein [Elusimicrobiota bacterium]
MKKIITLLMILSLIVSQTGCVFNKTTVRYEEKNNKRISAIKEYKVIETQKADFGGGTQGSIILGAIIAVLGGAMFLAASNGENDGSRTEEQFKEDMKSLQGTGGWFLVVGAGLIAIPLLYSVFFDRKAIRHKTNTVFSGQIVDENNNGIANYSFSTSYGTITTDKEGFFSAKTETFKLLTNIKLTFNTIGESFFSAFKEGKRITFIQPIQVSYIIENGVFTTKATYIEVNKSASGSFDTIKEVERPFRPNNNKITLTKQEFYSEKNKKLEAERIAEEKKIEAKKLAEEKKRDQFWTNIQKGNFKPYSEKEIFDMLGGQLNSNESILAILNQENGELVCVQLPILQVIQGGFLISSGDNTMFYAKRMPNVVKRDYHDGQWVECIGILNGTYSYVTSAGSRKTVPKVDIYAIRPVRFQ